MDIENIKNEDKLDDMLNNDMIVQSPPDYSKVKFEGIHITLFIIIALFALFGIRTALSSSSPRTKAIVAIIISIVIASCVMLAVYTGTIK